MPRGKIGENMNNSKTAILAEINELEKLINQINRDIKQRMRKYQDIPQTEIENYRNYSAQRAELQIRLKRHY